MIEGIEMPVLSYRWRIVFNTLSLTEVDDEAAIIMNSAEECTVNYKEKTIKLVVRQGITGDLHEALYRLCQRNNLMVRIDAMTGEMFGQIHHATSFNKCNIIDHKVNYHYGSSDTLRHHVTLSFDSMILMAPENEELKDVDTEVAE